MKTLFMLTTILLSTQAHATKDSGIFGWDILCKGSDGLVVKAYQADDDFYVDYQSAKDVEGKAIPNASVWADSMEQMDSNINILLFVTFQPYSENHNVSLAVVRKTNAKEQFAKGVITIETERHELNCYVRYGKDESDFDDISRKPFPKF